MASLLSPAPLDNPSLENKPQATNLRLVIKPSRTSCIVLASLTGLVIIAAVTLYFLQSAQIGQLSQKVREKQTSLANSEKISRDLKTVTDINAQTRGELQHLETSVTEGHYIPTLLHQTEELARATNLHVGSLRPTLEPAPVPPADKELAKKFVPVPYDKEHIDMDFSGRFWDVAQLLYKLTVFPKIMTVESVTMTPANTGPGDHTKLNVKLRLTGFIFKSDTPPASSAVVTGLEKLTTAPAAPTTATANGTPAATSTPAAPSAGSTTTGVAAPAKTH